VAALSSAVLTLLLSGLADVSDRSGITDNRLNGTSKKSRKASASRVAEAMMILTRSWCHRVTAMVLESNGHDVTE
jgi:hypothetical protein